MKVKYQVKVNLLNEGNAPTTRRVTGSIAIFKILSSGTFSLKRSRPNYFYQENLIMKKRATTKYIITQDRCVGMEISSSE